MNEAKRLDSRTPVSAEITYEHKNLPFSGRMADLSSGGFYIDTIHPLPGNSVIRFRFALPGDESETPITGEGVVVWSQRMQGMGIRITAMSEVDRKRLEDFLSRP